MNKKERENRSDLPPVKTKICKEPSEGEGIRYRRRLVCLRECDPECGRRLKPELRLARAHVWDGLPVHIPRSAIRNEYNKNSRKKKKIE